MYLIGVGRQGWQQKAHQNTGEHAQRQAGVNAAQCHIAHQRCQRCRQQGHGGILGKRLLLIPGIQPCPQNDGPDVEHIFSKQGEARHQPHLHNGKAVEGVLGQLDDENGNDGHQSRIDKSGGRARNMDIVCDQKILHGDDLPKSRQELFRMAHAETNEHQHNGKRNGPRKNILIIAARVHGSPPAS